MITDPYIGMPIYLGGPCKQDNPAKPGMSEKPEMPEKPEMSGYPEASGMSGRPDSCGDYDRAFDSAILGCLPLAMTYTPMQQWSTVYSPSAALKVGTVFPQLNLPFTGGGKDSGGDALWR